MNEFRSLKVSYLRMQLVIGLFVKVGAHYYCMIRVIQIREQSMQFRGTLFSKCHLQEQIGVQGHIGQIM